MRINGPLTALMAVAILGLAGCGSGAAPDAGGAGDIPDNQAFVEYRPAGGEYALKVPEGWARAESGGTVTFTDKLNTITVTLGTRPAAPEAVAGQSSTVQRTAGQVLLTTYRADASSTSSSSPATASPCASRTRAPAPRPLSSSISSASSTSSRRPRRTASWSPTPTTSPPRAAPARAPTSSTPTAPTRPRWPRRCASGSAPGRSSPTSQPPAPPSAPASRASTSPG